MENWLRHKWKQFGERKPARRATVAGGLLLVALLTCAPGCHRQDPHSPLDTGIDQQSWEEPHMRYMTRMATNNDAVFARPMRNEPVPAVLIFHHFPGGPGAPAPRAYETLTSRLIAEGIAVVRIYLDVGTEDFFEIRYSGVENLLDDARAALEELQKRELADFERLGALGYGTSGALALTAASEEGFPLQTLVLWSPEKDYREGFGTMIPLQEGLNLADDAYLTTHFQGRKVQLSRQFFEDLETYPTPLFAAAQLQIPVLGITGENAPRALENLRELVKTYQGPQFKTVTVNSAQADLGLGKVDSPATEEAIKLTVDWFVDHLNPTPPGEYSLRHQTDEE